MNSASTRLLFYLAIFFIVAATPLAAEGQENGFTPKTGVQEDYDKFKDKTFLSVGPQYVKLSNAKAQRAWFSIICSYQGHTVESAPLGFVFGLGILTDDRPSPGYEPRLIILADDKRVFDEEMTLDTKLTSAGVFQSLSAVLPPYVFHKIAAAKLVEAQIGPIEFQLTDSSLQDIQELDRRSKPRS